MSMTDLDRHWHRVYETMPEPEHILINQVWNAVNETMRSVGAKPAYDDRAEQMVAMITRYFVESQS